MDISKLAGRISTGYRQYTKTGGINSIIISLTVAMLNLITIVVHWINIHTNSNSIVSAVTFWILLALMSVTIITNVVTVVQFDSLRIHHVGILAFNVLFFGLYLISHQSSIQIRIHDDIQTQLEENVTKISMAFFVLNILIIMLIGWDLLTFTDK